MMIGVLLREVKEYKKASIATPVFMILEVLMEMIIPYLMASIIDKGVSVGDIQHIYKIGGWMVAAAGVLYLQEWQEEDMERKLQRDSRRI